jgi:hypothetical protein
MPTVGEDDGDRDAVVDGEDAMVIRFHWPGSRSYPHLVFA